MSLVPRLNIKIVFNIYDASPSNILKQTPILPSPGNHDYYTGNDIVATNPTLAIYLDGLNKLQSGQPADIFHLQSAEMITDITKTIHTTTYFQCQLILWEENILQTHLA